MFGLYEECIHFNVLVAEVIFKKLSICLEVRRELGKIILPSLLISLTFSNPRRGTL